MGNSRRNPAWRLYYQEVFYYGKEQINRQLSGNWNQTYHRRQKRSSGCTWISGRADHEHGESPLAKLFEENLRYSNGEPVKVVIADTTIGRVGEAAACADKFRQEGVDITLTVTPCWCYGAETMDMDPQTIKAVWGFNATERPGAVYLASVLATHAQKGLPAFGIYGHEVLDADDTEMPEDVKEKLLRFGRAAVAAATMRGQILAADRFRYYGYRRIYH